MRVLHVAESAKGGVGSYLDYIVPAQCEALGAEAVRVVAPREHRTQLADVPDAVLRTYPRPDRSARSLASLARTLAGEVRAFQPDIVHAHSTFAGLVVRGLLAALPRRPRIVYCPHGWAFDVEAPPWRMEAIATAERWMAHACDRIVAISRFEAIRAHTIGIEPRRVRLVLSGVPAAPLGVPAPWRDARRKVLFVGRLDRQKGVDVLFDVARAHPDAISVRVVGASVSDVAQALPSPANVELLGWLDGPGVAAQMRAADVVAVPSRWEGFGLVVLEAMRVGKPVVATRVGGLPELVEDGVTGRLTPSGDPVALAIALLQDRDEVLRAMGERGGLRYAARFTAARMNAELLALYAELAESPLRAGAARASTAAPMQARA